MQVCPLFHCERLITRTRNWMILLLTGCILVTLSDTGVLASSDDCVDDRHSQLLTEGRYQELEAEFKAELEQPGVKTNYARYVCLLKYLGSVQSQLEKTQEAINNLNEAVNIASKYLPADHQYALSAKEGLSFALGRSGDIGSEIRILTELLPLYERKFGKQYLGIATVLRNLAKAYIRIGNYDGAVHYLRRTLDIMKNNQATQGELWRKHSFTGVANTEIELAEALLLTPDGAPEALTLAKQAVPEIMAALGEHHHKVLEAQLVLANAMSKSGNTTEAIVLARQIYDTAKTSLGENHQVTRVAQNHLAVILGRLKGDMDEVIALSRRGLSDALAKFGANHHETILQYNNLADVLLYSKHTEEAAAIAEEGLRHALERRWELALDSRLMAAWQGHMRALVENYLVSLILLKHIPKAFFMTELFKTQLLADRLSLNAQELGLPEAARKSYRAARIKLARIEQELSTLRSLNMKTDALELTRQQTAERMQRIAKDVGLDAMDDSLPDSKLISLLTQELVRFDSRKTVYISYVQIHNCLYRFVAASDGRLGVVNIDKMRPIRSKVEAVLHLMQPVDGTDKKAWVWKKPDGSYRIATDGEKGEIKIKDPQLLFNDLGDQLLQGLDKILNDRDCIVISPDDVLVHVPYGALTWEGKPLVNRFAVTLTPSLRTLMQTRMNAENNEGKKRRSVLAFGGARYQRVEQYGKYISVIREKPNLQMMDMKLISQSTRKNPDLLPVARTNFAMGLPDVPHTREAAENVFKRFGGASTGAEIFTDNLATEANWNRLAESGQLEQFRIIHFSAHGFLSDDDPSLSSIMLDQIEREAGTDGYLTAAELSAVNLNSDLVVVSSCNSGIGQYINGEGTLGLSYALSQAGTRYSLLTLWPIRDDLSMKFMDKFYELYLKHGEDPKVSISATQQWAIKEGWAPRDWAPYVLYGY